MTERDLANRIPLPNFVCPLELLQTFRASIVSTSFRTEGTEAVSPLHPEDVIDGAERYLTAHGHDLNRAIEAARAANDKPAVDALALIMDIHWTAQPGAYPPIPAGNFGFDDRGSD